MYYTDKEKYRELLWEEFLQFKITRKQFDCLWEKVKCIELKKGQTFSDEFKTCKRLGYLISGDMCAFGHDINGKKTTSQFFYCPDGRVVTSFTSFNSETASDETIKALSDCILLFITFDDLKAVCYLHPCFHEIGRKIEAKLISVLILENAIQRQLSPIQQIAKLFKEHPNFFIKPFKSLLSSFTGIGKTNLFHLRKTLGI